MISGHASSGKWLCASYAEVNPYTTVTTRARSISEGALFFEPAVATADAPLRLLNERALRSISTDHFQLNRFVAGGLDWLRAARGERDPALLTFPGLMAQPGSRIDAEARAGRTS